MKIAYIYITEKSNMLCNKLNEKFNGDIIKYSEFKVLKEEIFNNYDYLIFVMATGIVVRSIAPILKDKFTDPGIIVMDELGKNVISLLSGHIGGANELTLEISDYIDSNPVITTATDVNNKGAFDLIVKKLNARLENVRELSLEINKYLLEEKVIDLYIQSDYKELFYDEHGNVSKLVNGFNVNYIDDIDLVSFFDNMKYGNSYKTILITDWDLKNKYDDEALNSILTDISFDNYKLVIVIPRLNVIGVGCRRGTESILFEKKIGEYLKNKNIDISSIAEISSIDLKSDELCILNFANKYEIKKKFYTREEIGKIDYMFEKSEFVKKNVGVYSVSEPSCYLSSNGNLIGNRYKGDGITISIGRLLK